MKQGNSKNVVIIEPGMVKTIDGKEYYNSQRIIAGSPEDVEAYHTEQKLFKAIFGDNISKSDCNNCPEFYDCDGNVNGCRYS
uniref:Uncharacterized protein n=1 Tax=viral metagenome TaxID=1070528 RepID=A0A6M3KHW0_9ZZZZ